MLTRRRQLAAKIETVEGVIETLTADDAKLLVYNPKITYDISMFERNPARSSFSNIAKIPGKRVAALSCRLEMRGSGILTTQPQWTKLLRACGFDTVAIKKLVISAIENGPYLYGEIISGGTSGATGRVVCVTLNGSAVIYYEPLDGDFVDDEGLTGGSSAATCSTGSQPQDAGFAIRLVSSDIPSLTMGLYEDGIRKILKGCRGKVKFGFKAGEPVMMDFEFRGVEAGVTDEPFLSDIVFETTKPPVFLDALFSIDSYSAKIGEMGIDFDNSLAARDDVNDARGVFSFALTGRTIAGLLNPEMVSAATHDFHGKWFSGAEMLIDCGFGAVAGNKFRIQAPRAQYTKVDDEDSDGIQVAKSSFSLNGSMSPGDDELAILAL